MRLGIDTTTSPLSACALIALRRRFCASEERCAGPEAEGDLDAAQANARDVGDVTPVRVVPPICCIEGPGDCSRGLTSSLVACWGARNVSNVQSAFGAFMILLRDSMCFVG